MKTDYHPSNQDSKKPREGWWNVPRTVGQNALATKPDKYPDPTVLTPAERLSQFGKLMLRAVERRAARRNFHKNIPDEAKGDVPLIVKAEMVSL